jgi:hypothetical protein
MQLEKKDTAKRKIGAATSKLNPKKHFAHRQVSSQLWRALSNEKPAIHMLNFVYEDDIKIKDKYFLTIYGLYIYQLKPTAGLPSHMRLSL